MNPRLKRFYGLASVLTLAACLCGCGADERIVKPVDLDRWIDLEKDIATAEVLLETRNIQFASDAGPPFLLEGWSPETITAADGADVRRSVGEKTTFRFVVLVPRNLAVALQLAPADPDCGGMQKLELELNGSPVQALTLATGLREYRVVFPEALLVPGDNVLVATAGDASTDLGRCSDSLWSSMTIEDGEEIAAPRLAEDGLFLPFGSGVRFLLEAPSMASLGFGFNQETSRTGSVTVRVREFGSSLDLVWRDVSVDPEPQHFVLPATRSHLLDVSLVAGEIDGPFMAKGGVSLRDLSVRFASNPVGEVHVRSRPQWREAVSSRPNVIIYLVDTLRADHLGAYGYDKGISPNIDAFARDAVVFEQPMAQTSWTRTAVASIYTGMVPPSHAVINRKDGLAPEAETIAEVFRGAGYDTASFVATGHVSPKWGMAQGFETFELVTKNSMGLRYALSDGLNPPIIEWLERDRERPFFLYVHTLDPHSPYAPAAHAAAQFAADVRQPHLGDEAMQRLDTMALRLAERTGKPAPVELGSQVWVQGLKNGVISSTDEMLADLVKLYDAEIYQNDRSFGELIEYLKTSGLYDNTVIVFLADHGEEFLDHDFWTHGHTLYTEQLRVPIIMRFPDPAAPRGVRRPQLARQIDVAATVADYAGLRAPRDSQGISLLAPVFDLGTADGSRSGYAHLELGDSYGESFVDGRWKIICRDRKWRSCELFDIDADPLELNDVARNNRRRAEEMKDKMKKYLEDLTRFEGFEAEPDEEIRQQLEALGYVF